jgi:hypothetical protein
MTNFLQLQRLEDPIMHMWSLDQDVQLIRKALLDREETPSEDDIDNYLLAIISLINLRCSELMNVYEGIQKEAHKNDRQECDDML